MAKNRQESSIIPFLIIATLAGIAIGYYGFPGAGVTGAQVTSTQSGNLTVGVRTVIACTFSNDALGISFGDELDPDTTGHNATKNFAAFPGNGTNYNISVSTLGNVNVNMTIQGTDLFRGANLIGVTNVSWQANETRNSSSMIYAAPSLKRLTNAFNQVDKIGFNVSPGDLRFYRTWIDIPGDTVSGNYTGNYSIRCTPHSS